MEKYINDKSVRFTAEEEKRFRGLLDQWCDSEKGYDGERFGQKVEIKAVVQSAVYAASVQTQYDERILDRGCQPTNRDFSPTVTDFSQIDVWSYAGALPTSFTQDKKSIVVDGSRQTKTCHTCSGNGRVTCPTCNGSGHVMKERRIEEPCASCHSNGYVTRPKTETYWGYRGSKVRYNSGGDGRVHLTETASEKVPCGRCNGKGKIVRTETYRDTCDECGGKGKIPCPTCEGSGRLMHYIFIKKRLYNQTQSRYIVPVMLDPDEQREICGAITPDEWRQLDVYSIERTDSVNCPANQLPIVGNMVNGLLSSITDSSSSKVCFSRLTTLKCDATVVRYEYAGKAYRCALLGPDWRLFAVSSPISDYADKLRKSAIESAEAQDIGSTWKRLKQIRKFSQSSETDRIALEQVENRMALSAYYGKLGGVLLGFFLLFPVLTDYLSYYNIVAPWTQLLNYVYSPVLDAPCRAVVGLVLSFWIVKNTWLFKTPRWLYLHNAGAVRVLLGLTWGVLSVIAASIIVVVLNYLGALHVLWFVVLLLMGLIGFVVMLVIGVIIHLLG